MYKAIIGLVVILMVLFCSSCVKEEKTVLEDNRESVLELEKDTEQNETTKIESKQVGLIMISEGYLEEKYGEKTLEDHLSYKWLPKSQLTHTLELFYNFEDVMCDDEKEKMDEQILELMKTEKNSYEDFLNNTTVEDLKQGEDYYYEEIKEAEPDKENYIKQFEIFLEIKDIGYEIYAREDGSLYLKESSIFYPDYETMKSKQREATIALIKAVNVDEIMEIPPHFVIGSAFEILDWYDLGAPRSDWEDTIKIDGRDYHRVTVDYIDNYDEFESYIRSHFSDELINEHNFFSPGRVQNVDNKLYFSGGDRGSDIYMGGSRSEIKEYADNKIVYARYVDYYYSPDLNIVDYTTEYLFIYEKIDGKWVFTRFDYYG